MPARFPMSAGGGAAWMVRPRSGQDFAYRTNRCGRIESGGADVKHICERVANYRRGSQLSIDPAKIRAVLPGLEVVIRA
jgi:hypothetical protein